MSKSKSKIRPSLDGTTEAQNYANRRNTPNYATTPNKPPNQPKLSTNYEVIITNKANFPDALMNVNKVLTKEYENIANCKLCENKPNTNPIRTQTNPIKANKMPKQTQNKPNQSQFQTKCTLCDLFLFFTFLCHSYNLTMQTWTIQRLLNWITEHFTDKGIDSPRLSAELLLSYVLSMERIELYTRFDESVAKEQLDKLHDLVERAGQNEPICYLTGKTEFYSLQLEVNPDCMIPRPETELLVERAIEFLRTRPAKNLAMRNMTRTEDVSNGPRTGTQFVCDLCTGCGCIAVAIAKNSPEATIIATDISDAALNVAAQNIEKYQLKDRITLLCGDLFEPLVPRLDVDKFDLIVCNPPYVSTAEYEKLEKNVKDYEPKLALFAGDDGLDVCRRVIEKAAQFLKPDAALMLEIGFTQGRAIKELLEQTGTFAEIKIEKDFHDNDRIATAIKISS